jgi:hypothetical protein
MWILVLLLIERYIINNEIKIEGYWYSKYETKYPKPIPNILSQEDANSIYKLIKNKERSASNTKYRGYSISRIDDKTIVGSSEYSLNNWRWPAGFAEHYVRDNRVKPTDEFLNFIGYKNPIDNQKND